MSDAAARRCRAAARARLRASAAIAGCSIAIAVFVVLFVVVDLISAGPLSYFERELPVVAAAPRWRSPRSARRIVILSGGFDLSAGAVISLVNVVLGTCDGHRRRRASVLLWTLRRHRHRHGWSAPFNGFFIAFLRLQPIVVTLSTMFIVQGITLLVMDKPGGIDRADFSAPSSSATPSRACCRCRSLVLGVLLLALGSG